MPRPPQHTTSNVSLTSARSLRALPLHVICLALLLAPSFSRTAFAETRLRAPEAFDGYTLLMPADPFYRDGAVLIDMDGNDVHHWSIDAFPGIVLPGGAMLGRRGMLPDLPLGGSSVAIVQENWDGTIEMSFRDFEAFPGVGPTARQAHDLQRRGSPVGYYAPGLAPEREGSSLVLAFSDRDVPEASPKPIVDGVLYELGFDGEIEWRWSALDHLHQFGLSEAALADVEHYGGHVFVMNAASWLGPNRHDRAGDTRFDQENILVSSRTQAWMGIVERATGDVVWTRGPDYRTEAERALEPLVGTHQAHMVPDGLPGAGNILVLDNGFASGYGGPLIVRNTLEALLGPQVPGLGYRYSRLYSRVVEFDPVTLEVVWAYDPRAGADLTPSAITGGVQRLPNGNTLITSGLAGRVIEVTPDKRIVWDYVSTFRGVANTVYRATRIPPDYLPADVNRAAADYPRWESNGGGCMVSGSASEQGPAGGCVFASIALFLIRCVASVDRRVGPLGDENVATKSFEEPERRRPPIVGAAALRFQKPLRPESAASPATPRVASGTGPRPRARSERLGGSA